MIDMRWSIVPAALAVLFAWPAAAVEQAGVTAAVRGQVDLVPIVDKAKHRAKSGEEVFLGDEISSLDQSGMQLMLLDETVFTIGPNTNMTIDEFVYDPATGAGQVTASLAKGVLRFVTGKIAQGAPEDMTVKLPVGTIGIRGTIGAAAFDGVNPALVVLLGPGSRNNADARQGRLTVTAAGKTVNLTRTGWGTSVAPGGPPTDAFPLSPDQIALFGNIMQQPTTREPVDESKGGRATRAADQDTAVAKLIVPFFAAVNADSDEANQAATQAATTSSAILDGVASIEQLLSIETGIFKYSFSGTFNQTDPSPLTGTFTADFQIDFGKQTIGGSIISIAVSGGINDSTSINEFSYAGDVGLAEGVLDGDDLSNSFFAGTSGSLNNLDGIIANTATLDVVYDDGSNKGSGSDTSGPREAVGGGV